MKRIGLRAAVKYLNDNYPINCISDDLHRAIGATIKHDTLAHSLRRAAREGQVEAVYHISNTGQKLVYYKAVPGYKGGGKYIKDSRKWQDRIWPKD
jgi:hypothetical protein